MRKYMLIMVVLYMFVFVAVGTSSASIVTLTADADSHMANNLANTNYGTNTELIVLNSTGGWGVGYKAYMRFELPVDFGIATLATMRIVVSNNGEPWNSAYNVYGLNNYVLGQDWGETAITWNNAPANDTTSITNFTSDATNVGGFVVTGGGSDTGSEKIIATANLLSFINTDTDNMVTLMINDITAYNAINSFASKENTFYAGPILEIDYIPAVTVTNIAVADSHVASNGADSNYGTNTEMDVFNSVGGWNVAYKGYLRFELPANFDTAISATMKIVVSNTGEPWNSAYNVYGLNDTASGQDWGETAITWNNAPANDTSSLTNFTSAATNVGVFTVTGWKSGGDTGTEKTVSTANLLSFINADTDRVVTLMIDDITAYNAANSFASRENSTYSSPQLVLRYVPVTPKGTLLIIL